MKKNGQLRETTEKLSALQQALLVINRLETKVAHLQAERQEAIAIIGMGCRFPGGADNPDLFWQLLNEKRDVSRAVPAERWSKDDYFSAQRVAGKMTMERGYFLDNIDQFDADFFGISPREAKSLDPQQRLLLEVSWQALEHAGLTQDGLQGAKAGSFIGIGQHDYLQRQLNNRSLSAIDAYLGTGNGHCFASGRLAYFLGLQGPSIAIDTACSSSLVAVHLACQSLRSQEVNMALAGGVQLMLSPEISIFLSQMQALSADGRCKSFAASADGFGRGEGCGILVLKRLSDAQANQDRILAVISGSAVNHDGASSGLTVPNGLSQQAVIRDALQNANIEASQIDYVEAHGTGTELGDPLEIEALQAVLGQQRPIDQPLLVGSVKTNIGHLEAAAGVAGIIKTVLALQHPFIPSQLHCDQPNPHIPWDECGVQLVNTVQSWQKEKAIRHAGVSSFGLSGTNAHVILSSLLDDSDHLSSGVDLDYRDLISQQLEMTEQPVQLLALSAHSLAALKQQVHHYHIFLENNATLKWKDICFSTNTLRSHHLPYRFTLLVASKIEAIQQLRAFQSKDAIKVDASAAFDFTESFSFDRQSMNDLSNLRHGQKTRKLILERLAQHYHQGVAINWFLFAQADRYQKTAKRIDLPPYPFQRRSYWVEAKSHHHDSLAPKVEQSNALTGLIQQGDIQKLAQLLEANLELDNENSNDQLNSSQTLSRLLIDLQKKMGAASVLEDKCYRLQWQKKALLPVNELENNTMPTGVWLIFSCPDQTLSIALKERLSTLQQQVIFVVAQEQAHFSYDASLQHYFVNPADPEQFNALFEHLNTIIAQPLSAILYAWSLDAEPVTDLTLSGLEKAQYLGCYGVFHLLQAYNKQSFLRLPLWLLTQNAVSMTNDSTLLGLAQTPLWGLVKTWILEQPENFAGIINLSDINQPYHAMVMQIIEEVIAQDEDFIHYQNEQRYIARVTRETSLPLSTDVKTINYTSGCYLITGGLGALGLQVANWLAGKGVSQLILTSRHPPSDTVQKKLKQLRNQYTHLSIDIAQVDVSNAVDMKALFARIATEISPLKGIIHTAGIVAYENINKTSLSTWKNVFQAKVTGSWILHQLSCHLSLELFINFSSIASVLGAKGQAHYAAANAFLDALVSHRRGLKLPAISINWGPWSEGGMATKEIQSLLSQQGVNSISPQFSMQALDYCMDTNTSNVIIADINWSIFKLFYGLKMRGRLLDAIDTDIAVEEPHDFPALFDDKAIDRVTLFAELDNLLVDERLVKLIDLLKQEVADVLRIDNPDEIDLDRGLFEMGLDSLMAVELRNRLSRYLNREFSATLLFDFPNIQLLNDFLVKELKWLSKTIRLDLEKNTNTNAIKNNGDNGDSDSQIDDDKIPLFVSSKLERLEKLIGI